MDRITVNNAKRGSAAGDEEKRRRSEPDDSSAIVKLDASKSSMNDSPLIVTVMGACVASVHAVLYDTVITADDLRVITSPGRGEVTARSVQKGREEVVRRGRRRKRRRVRRGSIWTIGEASGIASK